MHQRFIFKVCSGRNLSARKPCRSAGAGPNE